METVDDEFLAAAQDFIKRAYKDDKPFFVWFNPSRMHFYTHIRPEHKGISGPNGNFYSDGMVEYDNMIGTLLKQLDDLGIADNTIVIHTTDNGPHYNEWPDGGITPFRGEKNTNWEGAYRVPIAVRWPGKIPAGVVSNGIATHQDWLPTLLAAAGAPDIKERLLKGAEVGDKKFNVHIDGYNLLPLLTGKEKESPRRLFVYPTDEGEISAIRYDDWKLVYMEQRTKRMDIWRDPLVTLRAPKIFNLRRDPFERADTDSNNYDRWWIQRIGNVWPGAAVATEFFKTFIVSGGGIEFMRPWTEKVYGIPPEQVIGSSIKVKYKMRDGTPVLVRLPELDFFDDKEGKPVAIHQQIGRRPIAAFGNSDGDLQMLQWTTAGKGPRFAFYVHHTDAEREWAYDRKSSFGRLDKGLDEAKKNGWTVVDMKQDWKVIYPYETR
jgi:hypothetical protein